MRRGAAPHGRCVSDARSGSSLRRFLVTRVLLSFPMLLILLTSTFLLLRVAPGDPVTATLGDRVTPERADKIRHDLGLDRPLINQYVDYLGNAARGDFGRAITTQRPISKTIRDRFPATLELTLAAMMVAVGSGVLIGAVSARFRDTPLDIGGRLLGIVLYAAPIFWLGIMAQLLFSIKLGWFPTGGRIAPFAEPRSITGLYTVDALLTGNWAGARQRRSLPDPSGLDARPGDRRHLHPPRSGEHVADAQG